ncbi:MAG TPA: hypothetical protein VLL96_06020 [Candidatus Deferrimicrobiaceae bacterium]|nr:hypothetical protein [Candidatus Deferrimicrobiaceae bacterium]
MQHLKIFDWGNCGNCGLFLKVTLDGTRAKILAIEKYSSVINFGLFVSNQLNKAYPYSEPPIPENDCQELKKIMIGIKFNTIAGSTSFKAFKSFASKDWVTNNLMPKIAPIFSDYPAQVTRIMETVGFSSLLNPYIMQCDYCGMYIPKTRQSNCPICQNGKIPPPPS